MEKKYFFNNYQKKNDCLKQIDFVAYCEEYNEMINFKKRGKGTINFHQ